MKKITSLTLFLILAKSQFLFAAEKSAFEMWDSCPKTSVEIIKLWNDFDRTEEKFKKLKPQDLEALFDSDDWNGIYLKYFAPYLLPDDVATEIAKSCWALYETAYSETQQKKTVDEKKIKAWQSCIKLNYKTLPKEVETISTCVLKINFTKTR